MTDYTDSTRILLVKLKEFEDQYIAPYIKEKHRLLESGSQVGEKIEGHISNLTGLVHIMREHIEIATVREILILNLKEELEKNKLLRGGKLKLLIRDQMETILPILEQLISTDR